jgi:hypothetical protein
MRTRSATVVLPLTVLAGFIVFTGCKNRKFNDGPGSGVRSSSEVVPALDLDALKFEKPLQGYSIRAQGIGKREFRRSAPRWVGFQLMTKSGPEISEFVVRHIAFDGEPLEPATDLVVCKKVSWELNCVWPKDANYSGFPVEDLKKLTKPAAILTTSGGVDVQSDDAKEKGPTLHFQRLNFGDTDDTASFFAKAGKVYAEGSLPSDEPNDPDLFKLLRDYVAKANAPEPEAPVVPSFVGDATLCNSPRVSTYTASGKETQSNLPEGKKIKRTGKAGKNMYGRAIV